MSRAITIILPSYAVDQPILQVPLKLSQSIWSLNLVPQTWHHFLYCTSFHCPSSCLSWYTGYWHFVTKWKFLSHLPQIIKLEIVNCIPDSTYNYPAKNLYGINRHFKAEWLGIIHYYNISQDGFKVENNLNRLTSSLCFPRSNCIAERTVQAWS